jgi:hypothetical protein
MSGRGVRGTAGLGIVPFLRVFPIRFLWILVHTVFTPVVPTAHKFELSSKQRVKGMRHPEIFPPTVTIEW